MEQLTEVCRVHGVRAGEVRAIGALEDAIVAEHDQATRAARPPRRFAAAFELVQLSGVIGERDGRPLVQAHVALSRERDNGIELVGGRLLGGRVFACQFVIDAIDDVRLPWRRDESTGLYDWLEAIAQAPPVTATATTALATEEEVEAPVVETRFETDARVAWKDVVAASERRAAPAEPAALPEVVEAAAPSSGEEVHVQAGDFIEHPKFGRMQVERVDGEGEFVSARLRNQRLIRLSLEVLRLVPAGQAEGHNLFRAVTAR